MKISVEDLKKMLGWIEANSFDVAVKITIQERIMVIKCSDRFATEVEIHLHEEGNVMPKIRKTDILR